LKQEAEGEFLKPKGIPLFLFSNAWKNGRISNEKMKVTGM